MHPRAQRPEAISLLPCNTRSRHTDPLAQNLTLRVRSIGPRHMGHRGGVLDMMSSAHDSQAHCMHHKAPAESDVQHNVLLSLHNHMGFKAMQLFTQSCMSCRQGTYHASGTAVACFHHCLRRGML